MLPAAEIRRVIEEMRKEIQAQNILHQTSNSLLAQILQVLKKNDGGK